MAQLGQTFDAASLPESTDYSPIPAGWYRCRITEASLETTKAGTGQYIKCRYDVLDGPHANRVFFGNINIRNPNPKAEEIGAEQLGKLMRSIGLARVSDTDQLVGGVMQVKVAIRQSEQYGDSNEVKDWKADGGAAPAAGGSATPPPAPTGGLPWSK